MYRQAVPLTGTQKHENQMSHLAAMHSPPGSFWNFSKNTIVHAETDNTHAIHPIDHAIIHPEYK